MGTDRLSVRTEGARERERERERERNSHSFYSAMRQDEQKHQFLRPQQINPSEMRQGSKTCEGQYQIETTFSKKYRVD
jgi:hypothetical protein